MARLIQPGLTHWQHPNFMAFFPAHTTYPSILGELLSAAFSAPAFNWLCSPAITELETVVMDWIAQMLGLPECFLSTGSTHGGGVIQGSASEAIVVVMIAARERLVRAQLEKEGLTEKAGESYDEREKREDRAAEIKGRLVALGSEMSHSSTQKAANILGVRFRSVRAGRETSFRMTGANLRKKLEECTARGLVPFYLTATIGTTGTCAVDELAEIVKVKEEYPGLWLHIDAAYAGSALICPEYRELAQANQIQHFDSFNFNMHKWLLVNFDARYVRIRTRSFVLFPCCHAREVHEKYHFSSFSYPCTR
jgi:aromatic-L-amino-acid decarboxylase